MPSEREITPGSLTLEKKRKLDDSDQYLDLSRSDLGSLLLDLLILSIPCIMQIHLKFLHFSDVKEIISALKHARKNSTGVAEQGDCIEVKLTALTLSVLFLFKSSFASRQFNSCGAVCGWILFVFLLLDS